MTIIEMRQKRANLWEQMKALHERAQTEKRSLNAEEQGQWERLNAEVDSLKGDIDREERMADLAAQFAASQPPAQGGGQPDGAAPSAEYRSAFWTYMQNGMDALAPEQRTMLQKGFQMATPEMRALATGNAQAGGFTVADEDMGAIVDAMLPYGGIRQSRAEVMTTETGADYPVPTNDDTANVGVRLGENVAVTEQDVAFGQKVFRAYTYTSRMIRVPYAFLQDTSMANFESWLIGKLAERIGRITNTEFTTGTGNVMPEGIVTGSVLGVTAAANNIIQYTEMQALEHSVNSAYRRNAQWMFADTTLLALKQLQDGNGRPLWAPGIATRESDMLAGYPYVINDDVAAIGASAISMLFGDMRNFKVRDVKGFTILRLVERYADLMQVAFLGFSRHDSGMVDAGQHPVKFLQHP